MPTGPYLCPPVPHHVAFPLSPLLCQICSARLQLILRDRCSVRSCTSGMSVGGGELGVFLLCNLDPALVLILTLTGIYR